MSRDAYHPQHDSRPPSATSIAESALTRATAEDPLALGEVPEETSPVKVGKRPRAAAGIKAIAVTMEHGLGEMGAVRTARTFLAVNKEDGFDCQSCAWPSPDTHRKLADFCENGAMAIADELTHRRAEPELFAQMSIRDLLAQSDHWLNGQGRLTHPMVRREGATHFSPIGWDEAFTLIGTELRALASPDEAIFYTAGKTCNEPAFLFQLLARQFGTNNLPDCSNMCHESSGTALTETIGIGKGTVKLEDFDHCDTILIIGNNPGTNHPRMLTSLEAAKHKGATIIAINPMPETGLMRVINPNPQDYSNPLKLLPALLGSGTALTDLYLPVRVNGDAALLQGLMKSLLERDRAAPGTVIDRAFVEAHTSGFDDLVRGIDRTTWEEIVEGSGIDRALIEQAADIVARGKRMIVLWCLGLTQHPNGVENVQQVVNLLLLGGHIGRPGAGPCCVRGHSNVQGDLDDGGLGAPEGALSSRARSGVRHSRAAEERGRCGRDPPRAPRSNGEGLLRDQRKPPLRRPRHALRGGSVLPLPSRRPRLDEAPSRTPRRRAASADSPVPRPRRERRAQREAPALDGGGLDGHRESVARGSETPASPHLLSDTEILVRTALATFGDGGAIDWAKMRDHDRVRDHISRVVPGFEDFNARIRKGFFYLPNGARERSFRTSTGKAKFTVCGIPKHALGPGELLMTTVPEPRPVQHRHLRPRRPLPRCLWRAAGDLSERRRHEGDGLRPWPVVGHHEPLRRGDPRRAPLPGDRIPDRAEERGELLPGGERPRAGEVGGGRK